MEAEIVRMCCNLFDVSIYSGMYMHVFCANVLFTLNTLPIYHFSFKNTCIV